MRGIMKRTLGTILSALAILILASSCCFCMRMHTVTIDPDNGEEVETVIVEDGKLLEEPDRPRRSGYSFIGWYNEATDEKYDFSLPVRSDLMIIAHWTRNTSTVTPPAKCTVRFDVNLPEGLVDTSLIPADKTFTAGEKMEDVLPDLTASSFEFLGWFTDEGIKYTPGMTINKDTTIYARWVSVWDGYSSDTDYIEEQLANTESNEIKISTASQLKGLADKITNDEEDFANKVINLTNDIDFNYTDHNTAWEPIGEYNDKMPDFSVGFAGELDGNGHTIKNLYIEEDDYNGIFSYIPNTGYIHDLKVEGFVGSIAGMNEGRIENCSVSMAHDSIYAINTNGFGFIAAKNKGMVIACSVNMDDIADYFYSAGNQTGAVVGLNEGSVIACYVSTPDRYVYTSGSQDVGGVVGLNENGTVVACYFDGLIENGGDGYGGIAGRNQGTISSCFANATLSTGSTLGAICGYNEGTISDCGWYGTGFSGAIGEDTGESSNKEPYQNAGSLWSDAVTGMNSAIASWNSSNPDTPCNYRYEATMAGEPPVLVASV